MSKTNNLEDFVFEQIKGLWPSFTVSPIERKNQKTPDFRLECQDETVFIELKHKSLDLFKKEGYHCRPIDLNNALDKVIKKASKQLESVGEKKDLRFIALLSKHISLYEVGTLFYGMRYYRPHYSLHGSRVYYCDKNYWFGKYNNIDGILWIKPEHSLVSDKRGQLYMSPKPTKFKASLLLNSRGNKKINSIIKSKFVSERKELIFYPEGKDTPKYIVIPSDLKKEEEEDKWLIEKLGPGKFIKMEHHRLGFYS